MNPLLIFEQKLIELALSVFDRRTPVKARLIALLAVLYLVSPFDVVPDFIPLAGWIDDIIIVPFGLSLVSKYIPEVVRLKSQARAAKISKRFTYIFVSIGIIIIALLVWLGWILFK